LAQAVRLDNWKAIRSAPGKPLALYDLAKDRHEDTDIAAQNPKVVAEVERILMTVRITPRPHDNGNDEWVNRKDIPSEP
jgi:hypothetical protein